ncbi:MAG TPA: hypothetical protein VEW42_01570 [Candidatus Eisenbacteria bacterium]|nr:hypothetical protein [Candidatus Eisenbacteria bacterium]
MPRRSRPQRNTQTQSGGPETEPRPTSSPTTQQTPDHSGGVLAGGVGGFVGGYLLARHLLEPFATEAHHISSKIVQTGATGVARLSDNAMATIQHGLHVNPTQTIVAIALIPLLPTLGAVVGHKIDERVNPPKLVLTD